MEGSRWRVCFVFYLIVAGAFCPQVSSADPDDYGTLTFDDLLNSYAQYYYDPDCRCPLPECIGTGSMKKRDLDDLADMGCSVPRILGRQGTRISCVGGGCDYNTLFDWENDKDEEDLPEPPPLEPRPPSNGPKVMPGDSDIAPPPPPEYAPTPLAPAMPDDEDEPCRHKRKSRC